MHHFCLQYIDRNYSRWSHLSFTPARSLSAQQGQPLFWLLWTPVSACINGRTPGAFFHSPEMSLGVAHVCHVACSCGRWVATLDFVLLGIGIWRMGKTGGGWRGEAEGCPHSPVGASRRGCRLVPGLRGALDPPFLPPGNSLTPFQKTLCFVVRWLEPVSAACNEKSYLGHVVSSFSARVASS